MARGDGRMMPNREAFMNRKMVGIVISMGIFVAGSAGAARAQNSPGVVGMDSALRGAVERNDVPGVVALLSDRRRVLDQCAFGVADVSTARALTTDAPPHACRAFLHRLNGQADHVGTSYAAYRATSLRS